MGRYNGRVRTIHCKCVLIGVHCTLGGRFQKSFTIYCSYEEVQEEEKVGQSRLRLVFISFFAADSREGSFGLPNAFFFLRRRRRRSRFALFILSRFAAFEQCRRREIVKS